MVKMRKEINNSIIEELDTIYNPNIGGMDTEFKQSLKMSYADKFKTRRGG